MFDFFDPQKNPFMVMLNMDAEAPEGDGSEAPDMFGFAMSGMGMGAGDSEDPMQFMQQALMMQMRVAQMMLAMPFQMMKGMTDFFGKNMQASPAVNSDEVPKTGGFRMGSMEIPPEMLQMLLRMDMSPENLEKLQKALDFVFGMIPEKKEDQAE